MNRDVYEREKQFEKQRRSEERGEKVKEREKRRSKSKGGKKLHINVTRNKQQLLKEMYACGAIGKSRCTDAFIRLIIVSSTSVYVFITALYISVEFLITPVYRTLN